MKYIVIALAMILIIPVYSWASDQGDKIYEQTNKKEAPLSFNLSIGAGMMRRIPDLILGTLGAKLESSSIYPELDLSIQKNLDKIIIEFGTGYMYMRENYRVSVNNYIINAQFDIIPARFSLYYRIIDKNIDIYIGAGAGYYLVLYQDYVTKDGEYYARSIKDSHTVPGFSIMVKGQYALSKSVSINYNLRYEKIIFGNYADYYELAYVSGQHYYFDPSNINFSAGLNYKL